MSRKLLHLLASLALALSGRAMAQDAAAAAPAPAAEKADKDMGEEVVVTGTRIKRKDLNTPAPVTVLTSEQVTSSGKVSIGDFLQTLPEQGGAINTQYNNGGNGSTEVSLRNLGSQRTLVLVNGRRFVAGGVAAGSTVDLNSIPTAAIERIEILKDGASAVYGSDAIAGVVNIITKRKYNGTSVSAYGGTTSRGDGNTYDVSLTTGSSSEKGSLLFSAGYTKVEPIMAGDRSWSNKAITFAYDGENNNGGFAKGENIGGSSAIPGGRFSLGGYVINPATGGVCLADKNPTTPGCAGADVANNTSLAARLLQTRVKDAAGNLLDPANYNSRNFLYNPSVPNIDGYTAYSGTRDPYNFQPVNYLVTPSTRIQLFSTGDAFLGDVARAYYEASYVNRRSRQQIAPEPIFTSTTMSAGNEFNPTGVDLFDVRRRLLENGPRAEDQDVTTLRTVFGIDGSLSDKFGPLSGWTWDLAYNWGRTSGTDTKEGSLRVPLLAAAIGPSQGGVCYQNYDPTAPAGSQYSNPIDGCTPINLLHVNGQPVKPEQLAGLAFTGTNRAFNQMQSFTGALTGELFKLGGERPVGLAVGAEYTEYKGQLVVNPINVAGEGQDFNAANVGGGYNTRQAYAELEIPLLSNMPGVYELEADAALRYSHYNTFGDNTSYKLGAKYAPIRDVTLRGTYSTAYRAPTIPDLYAGASESNPSVSDPCATLTATTPQKFKDQCAATGLTDPTGSHDDNVQLTELIGGNSKLKPEKAKMYTIGLVLQPSMVKDLSFTVDYFNTQIDNAIGTTGAVNILSGCLALGYGPYCAAIHRDPNSQLIKRIDDLTTNFASLDVAGVDVGGRYSMPTAFGRFAANINLAFLQKYDQKLPSGQVIHAKGNYDVGSTNSGNPSLKALGGISWYSPIGVALGWTTKYTGSYKECSNNNPASDFWNTAVGGLCYTGSDAFTAIGFSPIQKRTVKENWLHDVQASYTLKTVAGRTAVAVGVQNVFDGRPPRNYSSFLQFADYDYQFQGRSLYARLEQSF